MKITNNQRGSVLIGLLIILPVILFVTAAYLGLSTNSLRIAQKDQFHSHSQFAADAGLDMGSYLINQEEDWDGTDGEIELHNDGNIKTTYSLTVTTNGEDKTIVSEGKTYKPINSTTPKSSIKLSANMRKVDSGGFSVVTGVGGLYMSNSSKILGGNVQVNGEIQLSNTAQIGLSTSPVILNVAHQNCPNPATASFPRLCNQGENGQPISISNSARIYGDVKANNQTNGVGMTSPGLTASSGVDPQPLPSYDRDAQKAAITNNQTGSTASCSSNTVKTWPANLKITGNVNISNNCKVTVSGNVWITGRLTLSNQAQIIVSNSLGTTRPTIMVDGSGTSISFNNASEIVANTNNTGFRFITYWSSASCSPDCADVTGVNLSNSRNVTTIQMNNSANAAQSILYAKWSRVSVSNSGQIGALVGQTVQLTNSATITFGTSAGESTSYWVIDRVNRIFN